MPGHPEKGAFYLYDALYIVVTRYEWELKSTVRLVLANSMLNYLATCLQPKLPYEWAKVESNDVLFGLTAKHVKVRHFEIVALALLYQKVHTKIGKVIEDITAEITRLGEYGDANVRASSTCSSLSFESHVSPKLSKLEPS